MDAAEAWLREHDPDYAASSKKFPHLRGGEYSPPSQEVSVGDVGDVEYLVGIGVATELEDARSMKERHCLECGRSFMPYQRGNVYCKRQCMDRAKKRRKRAAGQHTRTHRPRPHAH